MGLPAVVKHSKKSSTSDGFEEHDQESRWVMQCTSTSDEKDEHGSSEILCGRPLGSFKVSADQLMIISLQIFCQIVGTATLQLAGREKYCLKRLSAIHSSLCTMVDGFTFSCISNITLYR